MDHPVAIAEELKVSATRPLPADVLAMIGRLIEYVAGRVMAARRALRRAVLGALGALVSQIELMLILAARQIIRWTGVAAFDVGQDRARAERHLYHPPQAWAAP